MASTTAHQPTSTRSTLLPLILLALATIAAFATAISSEWANLSLLWTPCSITTTPVPTPLCFALNFFRAAHASPISRLEQAAIVAFLAALATITASEAAAARREDAHDEKRTTPDRKGELAQPSRGATRSSLASSIIENLAVPWLLYNVALGALAWQGIIIPAFLHESAHRTPRLDHDKRPQQHSLAIPLSVTLGLFLPASAMLLYPQNPLPIIAFLLFPLWISLAQRLLTQLPLPGITANKAAFYAPALLASTLAHAALLLTLTSTSASTTLPRTRSAMLLLELDHAAIFLAVLYWLHRETGGAQRSVARVVAVSLVLGPGAGVCVGWMYCDSDRVAGKSSLLVWRIPFCSLD